VSITYRALQRLQNGDVSAQPVEVSAGRVATDSARPFPAMVVVALLVGTVLMLLLWKWSLVEREEPTSAQASAATSEVADRVMPQRQDTSRGVAREKTARSPRADNISLSKSVDDKSAPAQTEHVSPIRHVGLYRAANETAKSPELSPKKPVAVVAEVPSGKVISDQRRSGESEMAQRQVVGKAERGDERPVVKTLRPALSSKDVSRLRAELLRALHAGDHQLAGKDLATLRRALGEDSLFVRRLSAFYEMKLGHNRKALGLYDELLSENADDADSLLNAAIIEQRLKHYSAALNRLDKLAAYPKYQQKAEKMSALVRMLLSNGAGT